MAIEAPWDLSTSDGRSMGEAIHLPRSLPVPLNLTSVEYDVVGGGSAVTVDPIFNHHMFVAQNAKGAATKFWHGRVGTNDVFYGTFGVFRFNRHAKGSMVKTSRPGGPGEPEYIPVPPYLDYTAAALSEPDEYWVVEDYGVHLDENIGASIVTGQVVGVPVHKGSAGALRSGQTVYAVDHWTVTVDPAEVVETHAVGYLVEPLRLDEPAPTGSGLELWTVSIYHDSQLPGVPIA